MLATPSLKRDRGAPLNPNLIPRTPPRDGETTEANRRMRSPRFPIRMFPSSREPSRFRDPLPVGMEGRGARRCTGTSLRRRRPPSEPRRPIRSTDLSSSELHGFFPRFTDLHRYETFLPRRDTLPRCPARDTTDKQEAGTLIRAPESLQTALRGRATPKRLNAYLAKLLPRWVDPRGDRRLRKPRCSAAVTIGFPFYISLWDSARRPLRTVKSPRLSLRRVGAKCTLSFFPSRRGNRWYTAN